MRPSSAAALVSLSLNCVLAWSLAGQPARSTGASNTLTAGERAEGWRLLFDGTTTAGWRGYRVAAMTKGWTVVEGALTRTGEGGDIVTTEEFGDFELILQWNVAPGGNSGIMYRVTEDAGATFESGPELQVLDDSGHADGRSRLTAAGSLYGLYPAPEGAVRPPGQWNQVRIVVSGAHVEHWLNGVKVVECELGSADWNRRIKGTKFAAWPGFGRATRGRIALQDHGDRVAYRDVKVRVIR